MKPNRALILHEHDWFGLMKSIILLYHATLTLLFKQREAGRNSRQSAFWRQDVAAQAASHMAYRKFSRMQLQLLPVQAMIAGIF